MSGLPTGIMQDGHVPNEHSQDVEKQSPQSGESTQTRPADGLKPTISTSFAPLRHTATTRSAQEAALTLESFPTSNLSPRNWNRSKKWRTTMTIALTGFISTCGSSIGVPGIHAVMGQFGVENEKVGVLITTCYVLGLGYVLPRLT